TEWDCHASLATGLDCGNPRCGFARIRCPSCGQERLVMFSFRTHGFCPSCHSKRREEWAEWMREELLLDVPHRQVVFTIPKMLRIFSRYKGQVTVRYFGLCKALHNPYYAEFEIMLS
ncbi:MAG: transposase zinc-binding domain-containing protein, partial [Candidatus Aminicenantales bacterium]